jgi:hypothetical protein
VPDITTAQVVTFANTRARVFADALEQVYQTAKRFQQEWAALTTTVTPPSTADQVADGSQASAALPDGRKPLTGAQLTALKTTADQIVTWFETGTPTRITQIQQVTVNGAARF